VDGAAGIDRRKHAAQIAEKGHDLAARHQVILDGVDVEQCHVFLKYCSVLGT